MLGLLINNMLKHPYLALIGSNSVLFFFFFWFFVGSVHVNAQCIQDNTLEGLEHGGKQNSPVPPIPMHLNISNCKECTTSVSSEHEFSGMDFQNWSIPNPNEYEDACK